jgi:hypothetical protein
VPVPGIRWLRDRRSQIGGAISGPRQRAMAVAKRSARLQIPSGLPPAPEGRKLDRQHRHLGNVSVSHTIKPTCGISAQRNLDQNRRANHATLNLANVRGLFDRMTERMDKARIWITTFLSTAVNRVLIISIVGIGLRLIHINNDLWEVWSWRQADVAMIASNFYHNGFDILHPQINWAGNLPG